MKPLTLEETGAIPDNPKKKVSKKKKITASKYLPVLKGLYLKKQGNVRYPLEWKKTDTTANGLEQCVVEFIRLNSGQAERIKNSGRYVVKLKKFIPGTGVNGSADVSSTIPVIVGGTKLGLSVKWEIKIGRDFQSGAQQKYEASLSNAFGYYFVIKSFDDFYVKYTDFVNKFK